MSLINQINSDLLIARKNRETIAAQLLTTVYSDAMMVAKNKQQAAPSDDETIATIRKFIKGIDETLAVLAQNTDRHANAMAEKEILEKYLPTMVSSEKVQDAVNGIIASGERNLGMIMKLLTLQFGASLDKKSASQIIAATLKGAA